MQISDRLSNDQKIGRPLVHATSALSAQGAASSSGLLVKSPNVKLHVFPRTGGRDLACAEVIGYLLSYVSTESREDGAPQEPLPVWGAVRVWGTGGLKVGAHVSVGELGATPCY